MSIQAFEKLVQAFPDWDRLAEAPHEDIEAAIASFTCAERKAPYLRAALQMIRARAERIDLEFLGEWPVPLGMRWLQTLPGAGPKIAAATLNLSTLRKRAFVVDTHVLRILQRFGFVSHSAYFAATCEAVMAALPDFDAADFYEFHWLLKSLGQIV